MRFRLALTFVQVYFFFNTCTSPVKIFLVIFIILIMLVIDEVMKTSMIRYYNDIRVKTEIVRDVT